jgi:hypothetical protein
MGPSTTWPSLAMKHSTKTSAVGSTSSVAALASKSSGKLPVTRPKVTVTCKQAAACSSQRHRRRHGRDRTKEAIACVLGFI